MLNASVGAQRAITRLRPTSTDRTPAAVRFHPRSVDSGAESRVRATSLAATARTFAAPARTPAAHEQRVAAPRRTVHFGGDAILPIAVAGILMLASVVSWLPGMPARGATGGTAGDGAEPRLAVAGANDGAGTTGEDAGAEAVDDSANLEPLYLGEGRGIGLSRSDPDAAVGAREAEELEAAGLTGPFLENGTLLKPIAVTTTIADGKDLLRSYKVRQGDTLTGIANRFGVSMMTVWWANRLKTKDDLHVGQTLVIPPVNGLIVTVKDGETLDAIAKRYDIAADTIYSTNGLEDRALVAGQTLVLPGATGAGISKPAAPKPTTSRPSTSGGGSTGGSGGGGSTRPPAKYGGGPMTWPVVGGGNYISQYYHYGHYAIDIAADYGSKVRSAAAGTVVFAGWKNNGGGYQVHLFHGSGLYTTYNHMSSITVGRGQSVARGQQVGRIGQSGWATGPHLHFEVWKGGIWNGGSRVNPLKYL